MSAVVNNFGQIIETDIFLGIFNFVSFALRLELVIGHADVLPLQKINKNRLLEKLFHTDVDSFLQAQQLTDKIFKGWG